MICTTIALAVPSCTACSPSHVDARFVGPSVVNAATIARAALLDDGVAEDSQRLLELDELVLTFEEAMAAAGD